LPASDPRIKQASGLCCDARSERLFSDLFWLVGRRTMYSLGSAMRVLRRARVLVRRASTGLVIGSLGRAACRQWPVLTSRHRRWNFGARAIFGESCVF